ncbi:hypothetical protein CSUI_009957, partial [Cystoisospora suis]
RSLTGHRTTDGSACPGAAPARERNGRLPGSSLATPGLEDARCFSRRSWSCRCSFPLQSRFRFGALASPHTSPVPNYKPRVASAPLRTATVQAPRPSPFLNCRRSRGQLPISERWVFLRSLGLLFSASLGSLEHYPSKFPEPQ